MNIDDLFRLGDQASVHIAAGPEHLWLGNLLEPRLWEALRVEMQNRLRRATGEPDAIVTFSFGHADDIRRGDA